MQNHLKLHTFIHLHPSWLAPQNRFSAALHWWGHLITVSSLPTLNPFTPSSSSFSTLILYTNSLFNPWPFYRDTSEVLLVHPQPIQPPYRTPHRIALHSADNETNKQLTDSSQANIRLSQPHL